jgi:hypothetical protein
LNSSSQALIQGAPFFHRLAQTCPEHLPPSLLQILPHQQQRHQEQAQGGQEGQGSADQAVNGAVKEGDKVGAAAMEVEGRGDAQNGLASSMEVDKGAAENGGGSGKGIPHAAMEAEGGAGVQGRPCFGDGGDLRDAAVRQVAFPALPLQAKRGE